MKKLLMVYHMSFHFEKKIKPNERIMTSISRQFMQVIHVLFSTKCLFILWTRKLSSEHLVSPDLKKVSLEKNSNSHFSDMPNKLCSE